jgi:hypothetical protein
MPDVLLVANRTCPCPDVLDAVRARAGTGGEVRVVVPALNRRLRHWVSDTDEAIAAARTRLDEALDWLADFGVMADGEVGDADPVQAAEDALARFRADEIVISTYPEPHSNWLEKDIVGRTRERSGLPVAHLTSRYGLEAAAAA